MAVASDQTRPTLEGRGTEVVNGAAIAAVLAAGIGTCAMGLLVILNETGIFVAPSLYGPAGGVSGRTTLAVVVWLIAWGLLHRSWKARQLEAGRVYVVAATLTALGLMLTFPPFWGIF